MREIAADQVDLLPVELDVVAAAHALQHGVVAGLDRDVEVLADLGQLGDGLDDTLRHVLRVRREEAVARDAVDVMERAQQVAQVGLVLKVVSVRLDRLAQ
jgi:hypothetical protein